MNMLGYRRFRHTEHPSFHGLRRILYQSRAPLFATSRHRADDFLSAAKDFRRRFSFRDWASTFGAAGNSDFRQNRGSVAWLLFKEDIAVSLGAMVEWRNVSDKPSVNGVVLEGNKTTKELGIKGDGWLSRPRHASSIRRVRPASGRGKDSHDTALSWCRHRLLPSSAECGQGARRAEP